MLSLTTAQPLLSPRIREVTQLVELLRDDDETEVVLDILHRASCYHGNELDASAQSAADQILTGWNLSSEDTCLIAKDLEEKASSADLALQLVRTAIHRRDSSWTGSNVLGPMSELAKSDRWNNVVLVDDFVGTGNKVENKINWIREKVDRELHIYIATFVSQLQALELLDRKLDGFHAHLYLERGITDYYYDAEKRDRLIEAMKRVEDRFGDISPYVSLGFMSSESTYFPMIWNTPDNVFPVFWHTKHRENIEYRPILSRMTKP